MQNMLLLRLVKNVSLYFKKRIAIIKLKKLVSKIKWLYGIESIDHAVSYAESVDDLIGTGALIFQMRTLKRYIEKDTEDMFHLALATNVNNSIRFLEERIYGKKTINKKSSKERD
jgi:hypothetical protein